MFIGTDAPQCLCLFFNWVTEYKILAVFFSYLHCTLVRLHLNRRTHSTQVTVIFLWGQTSMQAPTQVVCSLNKRFFSHRKFNCQWFLSSQHCLSSHKNSGSRTTYTVCKASLMLFKQYLTQLKVDCICCVNRFQ